MVRCHEDVNPGETPAVCDSLAEMYQELSAQGHTQTPDISIKLPPWTNTVNVNEKITTNL